MTAPLFPLFADLQGRQVLVVGGGAVAERKTDALLHTGARVRVVLRRTQAPTQNGCHAVAGFEHDTEGHRIRYRGRALDLTRYEYGLLAQLLHRPGAVLSRAQLMDRVWGDSLESSDRTIDTHIKTLRAKLRMVDSEAPDPIRTHRGLGYSLVVD